MKNLPLKSTAAKSSKKIIGLKMLDAKGGSISYKPQVFYPVGQWVTVQGNGAYVAISDGLTSGGKGPLICAFECKEPTNQGNPPSGVICYRKVKRLKKIPKNYIFDGDLDLSGCDLKGITLPQSVGGGLDLSGCDLKGITIPENLKSKIIL